MNKIIIMLTLVFIGVSCSVSKSITTEQLVSSSWKLKSIEGLNDEENLSFANATLSFSMSDSSYSGNNGCNMISGNFSVSQDIVTFGEGLSTRKFCQGVNEQTFNNILISTNRMQIKKDILILFKNDIKLAEFTKE